MRKLKLLMVALSILFGWGEMWATDYTSSLPAYGANWDITASGPWRGNENMTNPAPKGQCAEMSDYKFAEVYYDKTSGTQFEIYKTITVPNGIYIFQMAAYGRRANIWDKDNDTAVGINGEVFANDATVPVTSNTFVYYTVTTRVTDGSLKVGLRAKEGNLPNWWGYADYTLLKVDGESNVNLTKLLVNPSFESNSTDGWTLGGTSSDTGVKKNEEQYAAENTDGTYLFNTWWQGVPITQTIANLPNAHYQLKVALATSDPGADAKMFLLAQDGHSDVITIGQGTSGTFNDYTYDFLGTNNSITIGVVGGNADGTFNANGHWWYKADNFRLIYSAIVAVDAMPLPDGGAMAADTWYYFDIPLAAGDYEATADNLGNIICTADGSHLSASPTGDVTLTATDNSLSATRYYVKSSSANSLVITPHTFYYTVGDATLSTANNKYTQNKTFTVTFESADTNDPDGELTLLDANKVKVNGSKAVASLSGKTLTITLAETLTPSTDYTVSIEAGAVGFNADNTNAAISSTVKTPLLFDGAYYLKQNDADKYISRGGDSNTEATLDNYGIAVRITTDAENVTRFTFVDNNKNLFGGSQSVYTDKNESDLGENAARARWTLAKSGEGYTLYNPLWSKYIAAGTGAESGKPAATYSADAYAWTFETPAVHATKMAAMKDANAATVATAAGLSATAVEELKAIIEGGSGGWTAKDITLSEKYSSVAEKYQDMEGKYNATVVATQNLTGLENGIYKVSFNAFHRLTWNDETYNYYASDIAGSSAYLWANDQQLQFPSVMSESRATAYTEGWNPNYLKDGKNYPNSMGAAGQAFQDGKYKIELFVYVDDGKLDLGAEAPGKYANGNWICYRDLTLTRYYIPPTDAQKKDLADAIEAAEAKTLGFETGEYAPYNNVTALTKLAEAKAINSETASGAEVVAATTALTGATWTANTTEENAIAYGDLSSYETVDGKDYPYGWSKFNDGSRIMGGSEGTANAGLSASSTGKAMLVKYNANYGNTTGYTMPLKAGKIYKITFKYCGWGDTPTTNVVLTDPESNAITLAPGFRPATNDGHTNAEHWYNYTGYFVSTTAGNYVLAMNKVETGQQQIAWADMQLVSATELEFADGSVPTYAPGTYPAVKITRTLTADKWATAVYPFAVSGVDKIAVLDSYNKSTGALGFKSATTSVANEPFLMRSNSNKSEIELSNVAVAAASVSDATADEASLKGTYAVKEITNAEKNYVLSNNTIYPVGTAGATINPYRAYIQVAQDAEARLSFFVDNEEVTGIEGIQVEKVAKGTVYNLNGQRVEKAKKGLYIQNGKKIVVK